MKITIRGCLKIAFAVLLSYIAVSYFDVGIKFLGIVLTSASPLVVGFAIAYVLNILMTFYERYYFTKWADNKFVKKSRRVVCMLSAIVSLLGIIALVVWLVVPSLIEAINAFVKSIPILANKIVNNKFIVEHLPENIVAQLSSINWTGILDKAGSLIMSGVGGVTNAAIGAVSSAFSVITSTFISIVFAIYLLIDKDKLIAQIKRIIHVYLGKIENKLLYVGRVFNDSFHKYIAGQAIEAVILGTLCTLGMLVFQFPYAGMVGAVVGFTALIPIAGAYIGGAVGAIMMLTESPLKALLFIVFIVVLQQIESNLIYPKVVGKSVGLPAIWVIAAVIIGGAIKGVVGMLVGVPIAAALYRLARNQIRKAERKLDGKGEEDSDLDDDIDDELFEN